MRLENETTRGNISRNTEVVGDGDYVAYAEVDYGPLTITFSRARKGFDYFHDEEETLTIDLPEIDDCGGEIEVEFTVGVASDLADAIDSWDYVETCEYEVHRP